ncbi:MAG: ribosome maturation factor RimP [Acidaminococcaceae bacterium]|nr:ribosome maturation factor RimP [Acidaminococcaceae bacterium]
MLSLKRDEVEKLVTKLVEPIVTSCKLQLVDVEYVREKEWYLRIFIDKPEGIEIDDCQLVSEKVAEVLDKNELLKEKYNLEVSSPGIDRPLKTDADFMAHYGLKIDINFFAPWEGLKEVTGIMEEHTPETITIRKIIKGKEFKKQDVLDRKLIANIRPHLDF